MHVDSRFMFGQFRAADEVYYYTICRDIALAGAACPVLAVDFWIADAQRPLDDYVWIKDYRDSYTIVGAYTRNEALVAEMVPALLARAAAGNEIEMRTPFFDLPGLPALTEAFDLDAPEQERDSVYFVHTAEELTALPPDPTLVVSRAGENDRADFVRAQQKSGVSVHEFGPWLLDYRTGQWDTRLYLLRVGGEVAGFLRAERPYGNIYDIGWLYVLPQFRRRGYAVQLTLAFSRDCFARGYIPHYGYAVSPASARVAEACGYRCAAQVLYRTMLTARG